jgi:hypothetical protein
MPGNSRLSSGIPMVGTSFQWHPVRGGRESQKACQTLFEKTDQKNRSLVGSSGVSLSRSSGFSLSLVPSFPVRENRPEERFPSGFVTLKSVHERPVVEQRWLPASHEEKPVTQSIIYKPTSPHESMKSNACAHHSAKGNE